MITSPCRKASIRNRMIELAESLDAEWDTQCDVIYDDLEREFAELRFQLHSQA